MDRWRRPPIDALVKLHVVGVRVGGEQFRQGGKGGLLLRLVESDVAGGGKCEPWIPA